MGLKRSRKTKAKSTTNMPKTGRQPIKVPSMPPITKAVTPAAARAEPSAPKGRHAETCSHPREGYRQRCHIERHDRLPQGDGNHRYPGLTDLVLGAMVPVPARR